MKIVTLSIKNDNQRLPYGISMGESYIVRETPKGVQLLTCVGVEYHWINLIPKPSGRFCWNSSPTQYQAILNSLNAGLPVYTFDNEDEFLYWISNWKSNKGK